jgi:glycerophosphoryl diester phosphodiesterase
VAEGFPENSLEAVKRALSFNYGVEIDVQISLDKKAVVFHDYKLDRLTNKIGLVREKTFDELKSIFLLGSKNKIPLLSDVLNLIDGKQPVLIEIKDQDGQLGSNVGDLEKEVLIPIR